MSLYALDSVTIGTYSDAIFYVTDMDLSFLKSGK